MIYLPVILLGLLQLLGRQDVLARMCYNCRGVDCASDAANKVDCGDGNYCGLYISTEENRHDSLYTTSIYRRYCHEINPDDPQGNRCDIFSANFEETYESCVCDEDFCNANEPDCSARTLGSTRIRGSLAEKCKKEIEKFDKEATSQEKTMWKNV